MEGQRIENVMWISKLVLVAIGAISSATLFKAVLIPYFNDLASSVSSFKFKSSSFASPLYIYIAVNSVIAAIVVLSTYTKNHVNKSSSESHHNNNNNSNNIFTRVSLDKKNSWESFQILDGQDSPPPIEDIIHVDGGDDDVEEREEKDEEDKENELEIEEEEEASSLDDTWHAIITAKKSELRRSETFSGGGDRRNVLERVSPAPEKKRKEKKEMRKSETFADRVSFRRDASISPEELGRRADEFIKKVNADMRLQRLESEQRFRDMVNRGL